MTTDPNHDYAPLRCKTHDKAYCEECMTINSSAHDTGLVIKQTAYDKIHRVDFSCSTHADSAMILVCKTCVQKQLKTEYERGMKEAPPNQERKHEAESKTIEELRDMLAGAHERVSRYYKDKCDMESDYATLKQHHEKAREQIEFAHRIVNWLRLNTLVSPSLQQALKEWDAL